MKLQIFEDETTRDILDLLSIDQELKVSSSQVLYEELPKLHMLRIFEDHESVFQSRSYWMKNSKNLIRYAMKENKYHFMEEPEKYFLPPNFDMSKVGSKQHLRANLVNDLLPLDVVRNEQDERQFQSFSSILYMKEFNKKKWIKKYVSLRQDGIYFAKGDYKQALKPAKGDSKDSSQGGGSAQSQTQQILLRAAHFADCNLYYGYGWQKHLKSPTNFGFALKSPVIQTKNKNIAYFCCDSEVLFNRWIVNIRVAKYGSSLRYNYNYVTKDRPLETYIKLIKHSHDKRLNPEKYADEEKVESNEQTLTQTQTVAMANVENDRLNNRPQPLKHNTVLPPMTQFYTNYTPQSYSLQMMQAKGLATGNPNQAQQVQNNQTGHMVNGLNKYPPPPPFVHELGNHFNEANEDSEGYSRTNRGSGNWRGWGFCFTIHK